jgi:NAD(P)H-flavin reductase/hemoglobin-like flavoprotein
VDAQRLKENFAEVAMHGDAVALFFYSDLFLRHPEVRDYFPVSMVQQRDRLLGALGRIVSEVDRLEELTPFVQQLGRDHRKFGVIAEHFPAVGQSLIAALRYFSGPRWTRELEADWAAAYQLLAQVMIDAAAADAGEHPPWWEATVVEHERRTFDVATFRVSTDRPLQYLPGQSVSVEYARRPRLWRFYSMANTPRSDGTIDFHVRIVDGGPVSPVLVRTLAVGEKLRLGPPVGQMTLNPRSPRDILLVAGSTGLAPLKAILEQITVQPAPPKVHLFFGARSQDGLYDMPDLEKLASSYPWLTVVPAVSEDDSYPGERGLLPDAVARYGPWTRHDAYVCGSSAMVDATVRRLTQLGLPPEQIRTDQFG